MKDKKSGEWKKLTVKYVEEVQEEEDTGIYEWDCDRVELEGLARLAGLAGQAGLAGAGWGQFWFPG